MKAALLAALMTAAVAAPGSAGERALTGLPSAVAPRLALVPAADAPRLPPASSMALPALPAALPAAAAAKAAAGGEAAPAAPEAKTTLGALQAAAAPASKQDGGSGAQSARLARRFDGGAEPAGSAVRSLRGGVYEAATADSRVSARLSGGVLAVEAGGPAARAELDHALAVFGRGVRAISAPASAERGLGAWAADAGFTTALRAPHVAEGRVLFARADDLAYDRAGAPWRRAASRMHVGAAWERYESGGRSVWISRRVSAGEVIVAEYAGEAIPPAGTPATALAVVSARDGVVRAYVDVARAALLNPEAEKERASSALSAR